MNYPTHDTEWAKSSKGNLWRRRNGEVLVVGQSQATGRIWARNGQGFVPCNFSNLEEAKHAAETGECPTLDEDYEDWDPA